MKKLNWNGWTIFFGIGLISGLVMLLTEGINYLYGCILGACFIGLNLFYLNSPKYVEKRIQREERKKQRQKQAAERALKSAQEKIHQDKIKREHEAFKQKDNTPVKAKLIWDTVEVKSKFSLLGALSGATIFGLLTGGIGLLWGAMLGGDACGSTSAKYLALFAVEYATGRRGTEVVEINSSRFHLLTSCISLD